MIRRSPAEFYIKALIVKGYQDQAIVDLFNVLTLDYPSKSYIRGVRERLRLPDPLRLERYNSHRATRNFLIKQRLYPFFDRGEDMQMAFDILEKPRAKEFTETMLISDAPHLAIAHRLSGMYKMRGCGEKAIGYYKRYFFNTDLVDCTELRALLYLRMEHIAGDDPQETAQQYVAMKKAAWADPRRVAASLPHTPYSALIAQIQMGFLPNSIDLKKVAESSEMLAHLRLNEALAASPLEFDKRALNLAQTARLLQELREAKTRPEDELRTQLQAIQLKTAPTALPLLNDLTDGRHTVDLVSEPVAGEQNEPRDK